MVVEELNPDDLFADLIGPVDRIPPARVAQVILIGSRVRACGGNSEACGRHGAVAAVQDGGRRCPYQV
jgi:hypothetical protein